LANLHTDRSRLWPRILLAGACVTGGGAPLLAQGPPTPIPPSPRAQAPDSNPPIVEPLPAFFRSLLLPGWGQAVLDRKLTAGLFLLWEGVTLGMTVKTAAEVRFLESTESSRVPPGSDAISSRLRNKRAEREDWLVLVVFNHLFSGLEAYVSAHLWDFPGDLKFQAIPSGRGVSPGIGWRIPLGRP
jgi:hypothetical protein